MTSTFKNFKVKTSHKGNKAASFMPNNFNNHMVKVTNTDNGKSTTFEFWCSIASPTFETEYDVLNAFYCFVSDSLAGMDDLENFLCDFGYTGDAKAIKEGSKAHKACVKSLNKLQRIYDGDLYELADELQEQYA